MSENANAKPRAATWIKIVAVFACASGIAGAIAETGTSAPLNSIALAILIGAVCGLYLVFGAAVAVWAAAYRMLAKFYGGKEIGPRLSFAMSSFVITTCALAIGLAYPMAQIVNPAKAKRGKMENPPSHLKQNVTQWPNDFKLEYEPKQQFAHLQSRFGLKCNCGEDKMHVEAIPAEGYDFAYAPLHAICTACSSRLIVHDRNAHGWAGSFVKGEGDASEEELAPYKCVSCNAGAFRLAVDLQHPEDEPGLTVEETAASIDVQKEDLYTYITVLGKCVECGKQQEIIGDECD